LLDRNVDEQGKFQRRPGHQSERSERVQAPGRRSNAPPHAGGPAWGPRRCAGIDGLPSEGGRWGAVRGPPPAAEPRQRQTPKVALFWRAVHVCPLGQSLAEAIWQSRRQKVPPSIWSHRNPGAQSLAAVHFAPSVPTRVGAEHPHPGASCPPDSLLKRKQVSPPGQPFFASPRGSHVKPHVLYEVIWIEVVAAQPSCEGLEVCSMQPRQVSELLSATRVIQRLDGSRAHFFPYNGGFRHGARKIESARAST
jgi:hypothetical protein